MSERVFHIIRKPVADAHAEGRLNPFHGIEDLGADIKIPNRIRHREVWRHSPRGRLTILGACLQRRGQGTVGLRFPFRLEQIACMPSVALGLGVCRPVDDRSHNNRQFVDCGATDRIHVRALAAVSITWRRWAVKDACYSSWQAYFQWVWRMSLTSLLLRSVRSNKSNTSLFINSPAPFEGGVIGLRTMLNARPLASLPPASKPDSAVRLENTVPSV